MEEKMNKIKNDYSQRVCLLGGCSLNCFSSHRIGRKAAKLLKDMERLRNEVPNFNDLTQIRPPSPVIEIDHTQKIVGTEMRSNLQKVRVCLRDGMVGIVGIWGMAGVGKTTLLQAINNDFLSSIGGTDTRLFDHVIWVVVPKDLDLEKLRSDIAKCLGLFNGSKDSIFNFLEDKSFLLLLDDLWEAIHLADVGIPHPHLHSPDKPRQMVILTTRLQSVCSQMEADQVIKVNCLKPEEALQLFKEKVRDESIYSNPRTKDLAVEVVGECRGLPIALITIGRAMSTKRNPEEWEHALDSLKKSWARTIPSIGKMYPILELTYSSLPDDVLRACFLSCALWLEDWNIRRDDLIERWIGLGLILIDEFDDIKEAYAYGHHLIETLVEACLIENRELDFSIVDRMVTMHDVIRDLALWIATERWEKKDMRIAKRVTEVEMTMEVRRWTNAEQVSLRINSSEEVELQQPPHCPNLSTLLLQGDCIYKIPPGFFLCMPSLTYLNLSGTSLEELPEDIGCLVELQYLNISYTEIYQLRDEVGLLVKLRFLCMPCEGYLFREPQRVQPRLLALRVLDLPDGELAVEELQCLQGRLKSLSMKVSSVQTIQVLSQVCTWHLDVVTLAGTASLQLGLLGRKMSQGLQELYIMKCYDLEELVVDTETIPSEEEIHPLQNLDMLLLSDLPQLKNILWKRVEPVQCLQSLRWLRIAECKQLTNASWALQLPCLIVLILVSCHGMEKIIDSDENEIEEEGRVKPGFPRLRRLELSRCQRLRSICSRAFTFPSLEEIKVRECPELKKLPFNSQIAGNKLRKIVGEPEWWESLDWEDKVSFLPYFIRESRLGGQSIIASL